MRAVFADTSYYVALVSPADQNHEAALEFSRQFRGPVITTEYVLVELGSFLSRGRNRPIFIGLLRDLRRDPKTTIINASRELLDEGLFLFASRPDKEWSLTDCISIGLMQARSLTDALTTDYHFAQAGYKRLLA